MMVESLNILVLLMLLKAVYFILNAVRLLLGWQFSPALFIRLLPKSLAKNSDSLQTKAVHFMSAPARMENADEFTKKDCKCNPSTSQIG